MHDFLNTTKLIAFRLCIANYNGVLVIQMKWCGTQKVLVLSDHTINKILFLLVLVIYQIVVYKKFCKLIPHILFCICSLNAYSYAHNYSYRKLCY